MGVDLLPSGAPCNYLKLQGQLNPLSVGEQSRGINPTPVGKLTARRRPLTRPMFALKVAETSIFLSR